MFYAMLEADALAVEPPGSRRGEWILRRWRASGLALSERGVVECVRR
jgi:hypothetical protein